MKAYWLKAYWLKAYWLKAYWLKAYWLKAYSKDSKDPNKPAVAPFLIQCYNICLVFLL